MYVRLTGIGRGRSMVSTRVYRQYFLSSFLVALFFCVVRHAVLVTRLESQLGDDRLPWVGRHGAVDSSPNTGLGPPNDQSIDLPSRNADDQKQQTAIGHLGGTEVNAVATSTEIVKEAEKDELSALFGTRCYNTDKLGLPAHVARQCNVVDGRVSANVSSPPSSTSILQAACTKLTCRNILSDITSVESLGRLAAEFTRSYPVATPTDDELAAVDKCDVWRTRYDFNDVPPVSSDEASFPLAFNILSHQSAHQLARLLRAIYRPHNVYCVHVDARSVKEFRTAVTSLVSCFENVRLASRLEHVVYAGFSRLQADINCMKDHNKSSTQWRYLINTAGQAFPLRTNAELVKILRLYNGSNDIEGIYGGRVLRGRFENEWTEDVMQGGLPKKTGKKNPPPPHDIDIVRGSAYGVFSRNFVRFIVDDRRARDLLEWSRKTWSPDEFYWSTLHHTYSNPHLHSPGAFSGYPSDKQWLAVYANWGETPCHGVMIRGVCVFGVGDLAALVRRRELFANKFYASQDPLALDCLEAWLRHKETCPPQFDYEFYSKLAFMPKPLT